MVKDEKDLKMNVNLPEADFGKLRIWRPKEVLYRYDWNHPPVLLGLISNIRVILEPPRLKRQVKDGISFQG
jgi:hypothetical protein